MLVRRHRQSGRVGTGAGGAWGAVALLATALGLALTTPAQAGQALGRREFVGPEGNVAFQIPEARRRVSLTRQAGAPTPDMNITQNPASDRDPVWSSDGNLIAFASNRAGDYDIYVMRTDGSHPDTGVALRPKVVSNAPGNERYPAFTPAGTEIAYVRGNDLFIRNLRTNNEAQVNVGPGGRIDVGQPEGLVISFDGLRLAFSSRIGADQGRNIYWISLDPNNRTLTRVTDSPADDIDPSWFPSDRFIAFASNRNGDYDVFRVTANGPGSPPNTPTLIVGGAGNQRYPAWVNAADPQAPQPPGYNDVPGRDPLDDLYLLYADDQGGPDLDLYAADSDGDPSGDVVYSDDGQVPAGNQYEPFPTFRHTTAFNFTVYTGDQTGNNEIYTIETFDLSAPILSDGQDAALPTVTPQQTFPGATVRIEAPVFDIGSGVREVWAVIRQAEKPYYVRQRGLTAGGTEPPGYNGGVLNSEDGANRAAITSGRFEWDQFVINPQTYADVRPDGGGTTPGSLAAFVRTNGLEMFDDGVNGNDAIAGDGIWTATWQTSSEGQDYYVDIVPFDNRGNVPVDTDLSVNTRPGAKTGDANPLEIITLGTPPMTVIGYDHVAGFTTRALDKTRKILFVSDYGAGQKFQVADFMGTEAAALTRFWPAALGVEHFYFWRDDNLMQAPLRNTQFSDTGTWITEVVFTPYPGVIWSGGGVAFPPETAPGQANVPNGVTGPETAEVAFTEKPTFPFGGPDQQDLLAVWRILCRGPVDAPTFNAYTPSPLPGAAASPVPNQDGDRMIVWVSPYTGDLFVQPGTLLDADTQQALGDFVTRGGRLFITGQDIGWALTKNGTQTSAFLRDTLRVNFVSDAPADVAGATVRGGTQRRYFTPANPVQGVETQLFTPSTPNDNPITRDLYLDFRYWLLPIPVNFHPPDHEDTVIRLNTGPNDLGAGVAQGTNWLGDGAPNAWFIDDVTPVAGSLATLNYTQGGATGMVRYIDVATGGRVVFCAFPFEAVRNNYRMYPGFRPQQDWILAHEQRVELMTNISNYLRTGNFYGKVVGPDAQTPIGGITIAAVKGPQPVNRDQVLSQAVAVTTTLNDGSYALRGLSTATYSVYVVSDEFVADHRPYQPAFGGQDSRDSDLTIRLLRVETGTVFGTVKDSSGNPIAGARVRATLEAVGNNPLTYEVLTDNNGQYSLEVLGGTYTISASAVGFGSASQTGVDVVAGAFVQVDLTLQPEPGTLTGRITSNNQPVANATIVFLQNGVPVATTTTGQSGTYTIELAAGIYDLQVGAPGFEDASRTGVEVLSGQTGTVDFTLNPVPPGSLTGLVTVQGSGDPVGAVTVNLVAGGTVLRSTTTTAQATTEGDNTFNFRFDDVPAGTYEVTVSGAGFGQQTRTGVVIVSGRTTTAIDFQLQPLHVFVAGLSMVSTPFDYTSVAPDIQTLIDDDNNPNTPLRFATWLTPQAQYVYYPTPPARTFHLGRGYFMKLDQNVALTTEGVRAPTTGDGYEIALNSGWNLIGHVYEFPVDLFDCEILFGGQVYSLQQASARGLINASLYTLNFGQYQQVFRFDPYTAYWIRAFQNVSLRIPPVALRSVTTDPGRARSAPSEQGWAARIVARTDAGLGAEVEFGQRVDAAAVWDPHDRAQPPAPPVPGYLELSFAHDDWGRYSGRYRSDIRAGGRQERWLMDVITDTAETVELTWPALGAEVPSHLRVVLEDLATGRRMSMRHRGSYVFEADQAAGASRAFAISIEPNEARPQFVDVRVQPGRGGSTTVTYTVSGAATVDVLVQGPGGRTVRHVARGRAVSQGTHSESWDGRDEQGRPVPNGTYRIVLLGSNELGEQVRETRVISYRR